MYERECKNCGKKILLSVGWSNRQYCNDECKAQFEKKKHPGKSSWYLSPTKTPAEQCARCEYGMYIGGVWCCGHFEIAGCTRHKLHPEGLPDVCQEFEQRTKKRKPVSRLIIRR